MDFSLNNFGASAGSGHTPLNLGGVASSPMIASPLMTQGGFGGRGGSTGTGYVGSPPMSSSLPGGSLASSSSTLTALAGTPSGTTPNGSNHANVSVAPNTTTSSGAGATAAAQDKQSLLANEKRRRRRESHNAVERRRRDNINEKISELATLIPECMLDSTASGTGGGGSRFPLLALSDIRSHKLSRLSISDGTFAWSHRRPLNPTARARLSTSEGLHIVVGRS